MLQLLLLFACANINSAQCTGKALSLGAPSEAEGPERREWSRGATLNLTDSGIYDTGVEFGFLPVNANLGSERRRRIIHTLTREVEITPDFAGCNGTSVAGDWDVRTEGTDGMSATGTFVVGEASAILEYRRDDDPETTRVVFPAEPCDIMGACAGTLP